ncbi:MAG: transglycosylase domain-containing protein [Spirochaetaceae bacterium]
MPRVLKRIGIALTVLVVGAALGLWLLNTMLVPQLAGRLSAGLGSATGLEVDFDSVKLHLLGGVELEELTVAPPRSAPPPGAPSRGVRPHAAPWRLRVVSLRISARPATVAGLAWKAATHEDLGLRTAYAGAAEALRHGLFTEALQRAGSAAAAAGVLPDRVRADDARLTVTPPGFTKPVRVRFESLRFTHRRTEATLKLEAAPGSSGVHGTLETDYRDGSSSLRVTVTDFPLPRLRRGSFSLSPGRATGRAVMTSQGAGATEASGFLELADLEVFSPALAPAAVGPLDLRVRGSATFDRSAPSRGAEHGLPGGSLSVHDAELEANGLSLSLHGELSGLGHDALHPVSRAPALMPRLLKANLRLPQTSVSRIQEALPQAVLGPLADMQLAGSLGWELDIELPRYNPGAAVWSSHAQLRDFALVELPDAVDPRKLSRGFVHRITNSDGGRERLLWIPPPRQPATLPADERFRDPRAFDSPPPATADGETGGYPSALAQARTAPETTENSGYVRLSQMSPWVPRAVLTTEDGDFYYHGGVNFRTLAQAAAYNLRQGEIARGASTISMQLVKVLFLDDSRVFSRKLQEAFLVYLMEHHIDIPKDRILEVYLNIAEFGPGVYGVADAAHYYFDTDPALLSAGQAMWLATILPAPRRYHRYFEQGEISDGWFERMKSYYQIMRERGRMTEEQYAEAVADKPAFTR